MLIKNVLLKNEKMTLTLVADSILDVLNDGYMLTVTVESSKKEYNARNYQCINGTVKQQLNASQREEVDSLVKESYPIIDTFIQSIKQDIEEATKQPTQKELFHPSFNRALLHMKAKHCVYAHGPAGTGKTHAAEQLSRVLFGHDHFEYFPAIYFTSDVFGYCDAEGRYVPSALYRAMTYNNGEGCLLVVDEVDRNPPEVLAALNGALANSKTQFPNGEYIVAGPNFRVLACGNTVGTGPDEEYTTANVLPTDFRDRFSYVAWNYDDDFENIRLNDSDLHSFKNAIRAARKESQLYTLCVGFRRIKAMEEYISVGGDIMEAIEDCLLQGIATEEILPLLSTIENNLDDTDNKYYQALRELCYR